MFKQNDTVSMKVDLFTEIVWYLRCILYSEGTNCAPKWYKVVSEEKMYIFRIAQNCLQSYLFENL